MILAGIVTLIAIIYILGLLLPKERIVSRKSIYDVTPEILYGIVTDNENWEYRRELKKLKITHRDGENEEWEETSSNGTVICFRTTKKVPCSFYSFDMESDMFTGYWTATFHEIEKNKTLFTATEYITIKNPFIKTLSYLFFNVGALMENYQENLQVRIKTEHNL